MTIDAASLRRERVVARVRYTLLENSWRNAKNERHKKKTHRWWSRGKKFILLFVFCYFKASSPVFIYARFSFSSKRSIVISVRFSYLERALFYIWPFFSLSKRSIFIAVRLSFEIQEL